MAALITSLTASAGVYALAYVTSRRPQPPGTVRRKPALIIPGPSSATVRCYLDLSADIAKLQLSQRYVETGS